ncbi:thiamine diphosphate-binding protein [Mycotypha africana]|uniref:thiamine diphosphate-binding protein n=1 Tax=Mycotypha africana TaxID=64632 RepID=UPI002300DF73|nr:thiamine diphosphate-binding protein [Mycotypha africana]KAI8977529.1 thiamine diphosphate-binding protein [Mycotypha africana]
MGSIKVGEYLLKRIKEVGVDTVFGVPGDYNMPLLDMIEDDAELTWGNNANELNASYAADAYARLRGASALVTTFGVGELSAACGHAGAYSEMLPLIHIVGTPNTKSQAEGAILHHSLGNGNFQVFVEMFGKISGAYTHLTRETAVNEIDRVIQEAYLKKRPAYIGIPIDLINYDVNVSSKPLQLSVPRNPAKIQEVCLQVCLEAINRARHPIIIVDACIQRHGLQKEAVAFIQRSGFPTYCAPMGKGVVPEDLPNYRGCYAGTITLEGITKEILQTDLIIELGSIKSDFNTGGFTYGLDRGKTISLHSFATNVFYADYEKVSMVEFLPLLTNALPAQPRQFDLGPRIHPAPIEEGTEITHNYFWNKIVDYIDPNSVIVAETGTSEFASFNLKAPKGAFFIAQVLWGSIGYSVGAALGAAAADRSRRVYLFCGDGSFQLTCQEVSVMLHHGLTPVIFILNNDGYLIEKLIHGPHRAYNNFQMWKYAQTLDYMGGHLERNSQDVAQSEVGVEAKVTNRAELEKAMTRVQKERNKIHFLEVVMPRFDAPRELILQVETSENR